LPSFESDISTAASERDRRIAFVYPLLGGMDSIQVRQSDMDRVNPNQDNNYDKYLSDTAIDFMTKHIVNTIHPRSPTFTPFICSPLFYSHLRSLITTGGKRRDGSINAISTTWYDSEIHNHQMILAGNHGNLHFSATSVFNPWSNTPTIYYYDPMGEIGHRYSEIKETWIAYITSPSHRQYYRSDDDDEFPPEPKFVSLNGPLQSNSFDCAFYVLRFYQYSLSLDISSETTDPFSNFNENSWNQDDITLLREYYYDLMNDLSEIYHQNIKNTNDDAVESGNSSDEELKPSRIINKQLSISSGSECVDDKKYEQDRLFEAFLITKFGSIQSYAEKIPSAKDQDWLRKVFDQKLDLVTFWESKRSGINCGYVGNNRDNLYIYEKFVYEGCLLWAPGNSHAYDACPYDKNRSPDLYGYQSHLAVEVLNKLYLCGWSLYGPEVGHRHILWIANLTCCWNPRRDYILYDTHTEAFIFVQGNKHVLMY
jgi:hypothetical protein